MQVRTAGAEIPTAGVRLTADLTAPAEVSGTVLFAHGSGSSRRSPRNVAVAHVLNRHGLATVLVDLLTPQEETLDERTGEFRFDIDLLADRLTGIVDWLRTDQADGSTPREAGTPAGQGGLPAGEAGTRAPIGLFGASTGAAAALVAAAARPDEVTAVVSRGGRPDLAGSALGRVRAATLLLVGGRDEQVLRLNEEARRQLGQYAELRVVPEATHLFEEPGALEQVAHEAAAWFAGPLAGPTPQADFPTGQ
jgi:pimeloyl-ACP methyl ester carboxylesterase